MDTLERPECNSVQVTVGSVVYMYGLHGRPTV